MRAYYGGIRCHKCGASEAHLHAYQYPLEDGTELQEVRCTLCGWSRNRTVLRATMSREVKSQRDAALTERLRAAGLRSQELRREKPTSRPMVPCLMDDCKRLRRPGSKSGLCPYHGDTIRKWAFRRVNPVCPFVRRADGTWYKNPEYAPLVRGRKGAGTGVRP